MNPWDSTTEVKINRYSGLAFNQEKVMSSRSSYRLRPWIRWNLHCAYPPNLLEQYDDNRLIRPRADYKGSPRRAFVPVDKR